MTTAAHRNEKEAVKKWSLRLRSSQPPFSFLFRREENISNKNLYTVLSGRCSPFPYVVTLLYHTNIDNCVTKTRIFSEFSIFIICSSKQCIWEFSKCHKSVGAFIGRPPWWYCLLIHITFDVMKIMYSILHAMRAIVCIAHERVNTVLPYKIAVTLRYLYSLFLSQCLCLYLRASNVCSVVT